MGFYALKMLKFLRANNTTFRSRFKHQRQDIYHQEYSRSTTNKMQRSTIYRHADKSLARPRGKQSRKHVRDERDLNNVYTRAVIKFFPPCKARRRRKFTPFWQKHQLVSFLVGLKTYLNPCIYFCKALYMFQTVFRPSSGAKNCTHSVRYLSDQYCYLLLAWLAACSSIGQTSAYLQLAACSSIGQTNTWRCVCSF